MKKKETSNLKEFVKDKYGEIAQQSKTQNQSSCCGATDSTCGPGYTVFSDDYSNVEGHYEDADLGLGCGIPTEGLDIREASTILDLGSGAGNDCFVARSITGESGKVIGVDFSREMVEKAEANRKQLGFGNVEFMEGDIEALPLPDNTVDYVLSNCVLNLVPDKSAAFTEVNRVMKEGGIFSISDIVSVGDLPHGLRNEASLYAGCIAGALDKKAYMAIIRYAGFQDVEVYKEKAVQLPEALIRQYLDDAGMKAMQEHEAGLFSITVRGVKH